MTLTIELEPEEMQVLASRAARLGVPVERVASDVVQRDVKSDFMAQLAQSEARITAGTLRPLTSDDISQAIADARP